MNLNYFLCEAPCTVQHRHFQIVKLLCESSIDQFSLLDLHKTRILGYYCMAKEANFLTVKYLTGLGQILAVPISQCI